VPRLLISADSHVMEPLDLWTAHLPPRLRDKGPRIEVNGDVSCMMVEDTIVLRSVRSPASDGSDDDGRDGRPTGQSDPTARLADLDRDGVWGDVIYPNLATFCVYRITDPELQVASCRLYNDWLAERFVDASPRFCPVALLPPLDVSAAVEELRRTRQRGFRAVLLPVHMDARPYNSPGYEPLWSEAEALGVPLTFHAGSGRDQRPAHGPGGAVINYVVTVGAGPMETVAYLTGSGVLARHPDLRVTMVECGTGWLAWVLHAMDDAYREHFRFAEPKLDLLPSEYFRRQGSVTFQNDPVGFHNIRFTGDTCLMWGSDYPHSEGTWPESHRYLAEQLAGIPDDTVERVVCTNAARLYGFELPVPAQPI
jgi:predicted TIM-barrel fold metal-dependent hydrolase